MRLTDFSYQLPEELIARYPTATRSASRLLTLNRQSGQIEHRHFSDLVDYLQPGDLLVLNDTRVIPARLFAQKESGGKVEVLIERIQAENRVLAQLRASKSPKPGSALHCLNAAGEVDTTAEVLGRQDEFFQLQFPTSADLGEVFARIGHMPLPPYIKRDDDASDSERYQTVYARHAGAVAAPTAGLHFDEALFSALAAKGINKAFLTLHVGAGTFQPVRVDNIAEHRMHSEYVSVSAAVCEAIAACKAGGGRVVAVGTTSVRSLETAALGGSLAPYTGETDIFIYPGFEFRVVDALITNFHLPESTLLMLVSAFSSQELLLAAYEEAIAQRYRFFSYGDSMLLY